MIFHRYTIALILSLGALLQSGCAHKMTIRGRDGETLHGRWRMAREGRGLMQVVTGEGETLVGPLAPSARNRFFENYQAVFGHGAIAEANPDVSAYGHGFWVLPGTTNAIDDVVYGEIFGAEAAQAVAGPLFYWTAHLEGDRRTSMRCFLIGSTRSNRGLGRCKASAGKEYTVQF